MLTVTINNPAHDPGVVFSIQGLGQFKNGEPREIDPDVEEKYLMVTGRSVADIGDAIITVTGDTTVLKGSSTPPVEPLTGVGDSTPGTDNGVTQEDVEKELEADNEPNTEERSDT